MKKEKRIARKQENAEQERSLENLQPAAPKFYNRLSIRVYLYYAIILAVFGVLMGVIFTKLYSESSKQTYQKQLERQGQAIAKRVAEYVADDDYATFPAYLEILDEIESSDETSDVWIVSNPNATNPMQQRYTNIGINDINSEHLQQLINRVFQGDVYAVTRFSKIYDVNYIFVGVPIWSVDNEVIGLVLINSPVESQKNIIDSSRNLIIISVFVALLISFVIAIWFARKLSRPISKMRVTALQLAEGNYNIKTEICQPDELGDLAGAIDTLAVRLHENEEERKNMEQMRMDFFANVSHELRTPITVIRAYTETLVDGVVNDPNKIKMYYDRMLSECKSMERLVGDLLVLSKMQNPDFKIDKEKVNLTQIFDDILRSIRVIAEEKNISISLKKEHECFMMYGDYDRLRQMFLVIIDNSIKFSPEHSTIFITLTGNLNLRVSIRDEGIGISKEDLPNIFDKFYKSKLRQNAKGSGLGLAIAKQIAWKHKGKIEVKSQLGKGTEFIFYFTGYSESDGEIIKKHTKEKS